MVDRRSQRLPWLVGAAAGAVCGFVGGRVTVERAPSALLVTARDDGGPATVTATNADAVAASSGRWPGAGAADPAAGGSPFAPAALAVAREPLAPLPEPAAAEDVDLVAALADAAPDADGVTAFRADESDLAALAPELLVAWQELDQGTAALERGLELAALLLTVPDPRLTQRVMQALAKSMPEALLALVDGWVGVAADAAPPVAQIEAALKAMGGLPRAQAEALGVAEALDRWYAAGEKKTAVAAARALEQQGDPRLVQDWIRRLGPELADAAPRERARAVADLGATRSRLALPGLLPRLADPDAGVRRAAVDALCRLDRTLMTAALVEMAGSSESGLEALARHALSEVERAEAAKRAARAGKPRR